MATAARLAGSPVGARPGVAQCSPPGDGAAPAGVSCAPVPFRSVSARSAAPARASAATRPSVVRHGLRSAGGCRDGASSGPSPAACLLDQPPSAASSAVAGAWNATAASDSVPSASSVPCTTANPAGSDAAASATLRADLALTVAGMDSPGAASTTRTSSPEMAAARAAAAGNRGAGSAAVTRHDRAVTSHASGGHDGCLRPGGEGAPEFAALAAAFRDRGKTIWRAWADVPPVAAPSS